ncbi:MAG: hypothetical protein REI64_11390 [Pedobacter sp.]|uniref:hypothetical protein n=1 Tax=Pedobacter sp. TaxID=1411316 RepID=UPI00280844FA|nr:hypothetical protein [Pedobacter sp.]MDQ8005394.1 hypothetical protein [Pedobacter sp.]
MTRYFLVLLLLPFSVFAQTFEQKMKAMPVANLENGVKLTFDEPKDLNSKPAKVIIYALPNGNTTAQTFGKKLAEGDDWHFDIQHIGAQTSFIRIQDKKLNYIVVYLENSLKSWPTWRRQTKNADSIILKIVENIYFKYRGLKPTIILNGHSGGGSFIFGFINSQPELPNYIERISFLDATYGYETEKHQRKLNNWLSKKAKSLQVISYNDSVVVYNGKPLVSPTGGTWYRSKLMARDLEASRLQETEDQFILQHKSASFILIKNPEAKIYHTVLVEKNGFIHSIFNGTKFANKNYLFWDKRAYENFILE